MKKSMVLTVAVCAAVALASCSSSKESAYKKAYERAQQEQQTAPAEPEVPVVAPVEETPAVQTPAQPQENYDSVPVRHENVSYESGENLKAFSVVVGSYSVKANANDMLSRLQNAGYNASIASAMVNGTKFYRVISGTYDTKAEAARNKANVSGGSFNPKGDAWLLAK